MRTIALMLAGVLATSAPVAAQPPVTGDVTMMFDVVGRPAGDGREADVEWRPRLFLEHRRDFGAHVRLRVSGYVEALVADRHQPESPTLDLIGRPKEFYVEYVSERADLRVGYSRLVWGRLDELQPTDVVNPLDLTAFFFEGRAEARIPVALARARLFLPASTSLEAIVVPQFRPGRFDQLDEPTSPFNLLAGPGPGTSADRGAGPRTTWSNLQGGVRLQTTTGRVDWSVSAYRGFETFGVVQLTPDFMALEEVFPRFTMVGGDFEAVRGEWGIRGEVAVFLDDSFQALPLPGVLSGQSVEGGLGADRKAGDFRVSGTVLVRRRFVDDGQATRLDEHDINLIASIDRSFDRQTRRVQVFGVYDPTEATSFLRGIFTVALTDRLSIEASGGLFSGAGPDTLGRFADRDFVLVKLTRDF